MPFGSDRAMVTVDPGVRASAADVAAGSPRAVATNLDILHVVPEGARAYVTCGDDEARAFKGRPPAALAGARALFVNRVEALGLTGAATVEEAAAALAELAESVVVSLGADGGIIATGGAGALDAPAERVDAPVDTTGAGDLLAAAYIWADLHGADPLDRLRWATLYASLGVSTPTGIGGALTEAELVAAGAERGLRPPPLVGAARSPPLHQDRVRRLLGAAARHRSHAMVQVDVAVLGQHVRDGARVAGALELLDPPAVDLDVAGVELRKLDPLGGRVLEYAGCPSVPPGSLTTAWPT